MNPLGVTCGTHTHRRGAGNIPSEAQCGSRIIDNTSQPHFFRNTLAVALAGRVPLRGETITHTSGLSFRVLDADSRRIRKLRVTPPAPAPEVDAA